MKKQKATYKSNDINLVIDTNLQQEYLDVESSIKYTIDTKEAIVSTEKAFEKIKPTIDSLIERGVIYKTSFRIHLINDSIWIIRNEVASSEKELYFGGTVYFEVRKMDGCILKCIIEE